MIPRWIVTRIIYFTLKLGPWVMIPRWIVTPCLDSTYELWPRVKLWPWVRITIQCGILTRGHNSTLNFDPDVTIQRGILTRPHIFYPWNCDSRRCQNSSSVIKIQQLRRVIIQRKIHWILTPGRYSIGGSKFYLTGLSMHIFDMNIFYILKCVGGGGGVWGSSPRKFLSLQDSDKSRIPFQKRHRWEV